MLTMFAKIALWGVGGLLALLGIILIAGFINGFRQHATGGTIAIRGISAIATIAVAAGLIFWGISIPSTAKDGTDDAGKVDAIEGYTPVEAEPGEPAEEFEENAFFVDFNRSQLTPWLKEVFGEDFNLNRDILLNYSEDLMADNAAKRNAAVKAAMRKYIDKNSEGFQDAVWYPFERVLEQVLGEGKAEWQKMTNEEREAYLNEEVRKQVYLEILRDPIYCDMWLQWIHEFDVKFNGIITEQNQSWLPGFIDEMNSAYASEKPPYGICAFFEMISSYDDPYQLKVDYVLNAARVCKLLEQFDWTVPPVQSLTSSVNWHMGLSADNNTSRTVRSTEPDKLPAAILIRNYKSGNPAMKGGVNLFDGRAEIFEAKVTNEPIEITVPEEPEPEPEPTDPPKQEEPKSYTLRIKYQYEDGSKAADDYSATLKQGAKYSVTSPTIPGYTPDKSVVSGTMPGKNVTITVTYKKDKVDDPSYKLTIHYVYAEGGNVCADHIENHKAGEAYDVDSPTVKGYTADKTKVTGTMPKGDHEETVTYTKVVIPEYTLTVHYVFSDGGKAFDDHVEKHPAGEKYSVNSPALSGYTVDKAVVSGKMPNGNHEETVTYTQTKETLYRLTINYVYTNGKTAATSYTANLKAKATYSVNSPSISGYTADRTVVKGEMPAKDWVETVTYTKNEDPTYTLRIYYRYEDGSQAAPMAERKLKANATYNVSSPTISGYTADRTVVSGTMPAQDKDEFVTYKKNADPTYTLKIYYRYAGTNGIAAADYSATLKQGAKYSVTSPTIPGYTPDKSVVSGTMPAQDVEVTVIYTRNADPTYTLTVHYVYENGGTAAADYTANLKANATYNVSSPTIAGYSPDKASVSGTMPANDVTLTVTYYKDRIQHQLTIYYVYSSGGTAAKTHTSTHYEGDAYSVDSPVIDGYTANQDTVAGTMPAGDVTLTVYYTKNKNPGDSSGNDDDTPGGDLDDDDGSGEFQGDEPTVEDVPTQASLGDTETGYGGTDTTGNAADRQESSNNDEDKKTVTADDDSATTTGTGGDSDPNVTDPNGGTTHGGDAPKNDKIPVHDETEAIIPSDKEGDGNGSSTGDGSGTGDGNPGGTSVPVSGTTNENEVAEPEMED